MTIAALFGKVREHEIEMQRLNELESNEKKVKNIALKTSTKRNDELEDEVVESSDNENLNLLVKRFGKFLKRRGNKGKSRRYNSKQVDLNNTSSFTCYNCGKQGHMKIECPNLNKDISANKKKESKHKERHAYIAWGDNDDSTSSLSQEESEESNLYLMARYESSLLSQVSSIDKNDYNQLLHDFEELYCEANKISVINNRLKGLNNWLENKVNHLETQIVDLKVNFEHLDMIYNNLNYCSENQLIVKPCENCTHLENKANTL